MQTQNTNEKDNLIFKNPSILKVMVDICKNENDLLNTIDFIYKKIEISFVNRYLAHECGFDSFLLDILFQYKQDIEDRSIIVDKILSILSLIYDVISSSTIVQKHISLLAPMNKRFISIYQENYIKALIDMLSKGSKKPKFYSKLASEIPGYFIRNIPLSGIQNGFNFSFLIFLEPTDLIYQKELFKLYDETGNSFSLILDGNYIIGILDASNKISKFKLKDCIPIGRWNLISINYILKKDKLKIIYHFNEDIYSSIEINSNSISFDNTLSLDLFKKNMKYREQKTIGYLSSFGLYKVDFEFQNFRKWILDYQIKPNDCIVHFNFFEEDQNIKLYSQKQIPQINIINLDKTSKYDLTFQYILINLVKLETLLPIFSQSRLIPLNNSDPPIFTELAIDLFYNLISEYKNSNNSELRNSFENCIKMISCILINSTNNVITYDLYIKFTKLADLFLEPDILRILFDRIILNYEIWDKPNKNCQLKIYSDWNLNLVEKFYYYFDFNSILIKIQDINTQNFSIFSEILIKLAKIGKFTNDNLDNLIGLILSKADFDIVKILLSVIANISSLKKYNFISQKIGLLHRLIGYNDEDILILLISIITNVFHKNDEMIQAEIHLKSLSSLLSKKLSTHTLLEKVIAFDNNLIFIIGCNIALKGNLIREFIQNLDNDIKLNSFEKKLYAILLFSDEKYNDEMIFNLLSNQIDEIPNVCLIMEVYFSSTHKQNKVIEFLDYVLNNKFNLCEKYLRDILSTSYFFLLFKSKEIKDDFIYSLFKRYCSYEIDIPNNSIDGTKMLNALTNQLKHYLKNFNYKLGLNIDANGEWKDLLYAKKCIKIFEKMPNKIEFLAFNLILCSFVLRFDLDFIKQHVEMMHYINYTQYTSENYFQFLAITSSALQIELNIPKITINTKIMEYTIDPTKTFLKLLKDLLSVGNEILESEKDNQQQQVDFMLLTNNKTEESFLNLIKNYEKSTSEENEKNYYKWHELFSNLSNGIWKSSNQENIKLHLKQDITTCGNLYLPIKMKQNIHFTNHLMASIARDTGSLKEAQKKVKELLLDKNSNFSQINTNYNMINKVSIITKPHEEFPCTHIRKQNMVKYMLLIYNNQMVLTSEKKVHVIMHSNIISIYQRYYFYAPSAIEINTVQKKSYFLVFDSPSTLLRLKKYIKFTPLVPIAQITEKWREREISNFEYLMNINYYCGRTFSDLSQYPFLPWIITNFESEKLDLKDPSNYRDFAYPPSSLDPNLFEANKAKYPSLGYFYNSGPICPLSLFKYFVRLEPFTTMHIDFQSGKFDNTKRIIFDMRKCFQTSVCDNCELPPEFFYSPEFLVNLDGFDLGSEGNGDIRLPPWAKIPMDIIYMNRKALESDYVSENINKWIDLFFGVKQFDEDSGNVYHKYMYSNYINNAKPEEKKTMESLLNQCGQIPIRLFNEPHPKRNCLRRSRSSKSVKVKQFTHIKETNFKFTLTKETKIISVVFSYDKSLVMTFLTSSNEIHKHKFLDVKRVVDTEKMIDIRKIRTYKVSNIVPSISFFINTDYLLYLSSDTRRFVIYNLKNNTTKYSGQAFCAIKFIISDGNYILAIDNNSIIYVWKLSDIDKRIFQIEPTHGEYISGDISDDFDLMVLGTEGFLDFVSLRRCIVEQTIEIGEEKPLSIKISKSFGFVLVYSSGPKLNEYYLSLFNVNGMFLRKVTLSEPVTSIITWKDNKGFDFACLCLSNSKVIIFELYYMKLSNVIPISNKNKIKSIHYINNEQILICTFDNDEMVMIPYETEIQDI